MTGERGPGGPHRTADARVADDAGGALVEFLGVTVLLLVPILYGAIALGQLQAATYAAEGASAAAARGAAIAIADAVDAGASDEAAAAAGLERAAAVAALAAEDFGVAGQREVEVACGAAGCVGPDGEVAAHVHLTVPLPGAPAFLRDVIPLEVTVSGHGRADTAAVEATS